MLAQIAGITPAAANASRGQSALEEIIVSVRKITALALSTALVMATTLPAVAQNKKHHKGYHKGGHHHGHHHRHRGGLSTGAAIGLGLGAAALGAAVAAPAYGYRSGGYWANQCQYWDGYVWHWTC
jgi:hypothetical protein